MSEYLLIDLVILFFPLLATFHPKVGYYRRFGSVFFSILSVGSFFVLWDVFFTARGNWFFNSEYLLGVVFMNLPLEELLFFVVVPYSCLFIYESLRVFTTDSVVFFSRLFYALIGSLMFLLSIFLIDLEYTSVVLFFSSLFLFFASFKLKKMFSSGRYWIYLGLSFCFFVVFNYLLTSMPIVIYNPKAITGLRFLTIPLEDFVYNYLMLSMYLVSYLFSERYLF